MSRFRSLIVLSLSGCVMGGDELDDIGYDEAEIVGQSATQPPELVTITRGSGWSSNSVQAFLVHDHLAVGPIIPRDSWIAPINQLTFRSGNAAAANVRFVNPVGPVWNTAVYHLDRPEGLVDRVDYRAPADIVGRALVCMNNYGSATQIRSVLVEVQSANTSELTTRSVSQIEYLQSFDLGVPCFTTTLPRRLVGITKTVDQSARTAVLYRAANLDPWFDGMVNLARVRNDVRTEGPFALSTKTAQASPATMCIDIPNAHYASQTTLQQYGCHYGHNQLWYLDHRSTDPQFPRFVSAVSGRCIDVPWATGNPGQSLQQFDCHDGANQKLQITSRTDGQVRPRSGVATSSAGQCMAVRGGPLIAPATVEQQTCINNNFAFQELWTFEARSLPPN